MRTAAFPVSIVVVLATVFLGVTAPRAATQIEDVEQQLGPFSLGPSALPLQLFTVVLHGKHVRGAPDADALASLEIRDAAGVVHHREALAYHVGQGSFSEGCSASAEVLSGSVAQGLLVSIGCLPSAPASGDTWEIFGVVQGKLVRFGKPFTTTGQMLGLVPTPVVRSGNAVQISPDVLRFRVFTGNFHVTVPVRVDWMQGRLALGMRCFEQTGHGLAAAGCELPVEAERVPADEEPTFVRLFVEASEKMGIPRHVVVKKDSEVHILAAKVRLSWDESGEVVSFGVQDQDPWLKVRIDGKEGWIHTEEDFYALGLPQAG